MSSSKKKAGFSFANKNGGKKQYRKQLNKTKAGFSGEKALHFSTSFHQHNTFHNASKRAPAWLQNKFN